MGVLTFYLLLQSYTKTWFIVGTGIGLFWFWWITLSLKHYEMLWAIPIELIVIMLSYGFLFAFISWFSHKIPTLLQVQTTLLPLLLKALGLLGVSYVHPFGFDWFKPELIFVESYFGISKIAFGIILFAIILSLWKKQLLYLLLSLFALAPMSSNVVPYSKNIALITTHTSVQDKWDELKHQAQFDAILDTIDEAIVAKKHLVILPESVFPIFLNHSDELMEALKQKAKHITIVVGALYWDGETPRNSTYIFNKDQIQIANKVLLVPFGEANPLPDFLSDWVNEVFYDDAVDYKASSAVSDYTIDGTTYRNAICFEATSEKLYEKDKNATHPKHMIVLSNNGWFTPSIEPTLQKLLLKYYSKKYGTNIYHSVNMSPSYIIQNGQELEVPKMTELQIESGSSQ